MKNYKKIERQLGFSIFFCYYIKNIWIELYERYKSIVEIFIFL